MALTAIVQMPVEDGEVGKNLDSALTLVEAHSGAQVYILPELFTTGYAHSVWASAGQQYTQILERLRSFARHVDALLCGSMIASVGGSLRNRMFVVFPDDRVPVEYDKIHLFGLMDEDRYLKSGGSLSQFEAGGLRFGLAVCYDLRFPAMFQQMGPSTDAFLVASEWPEPRCATMTLIARARAAENQCYLLLSNRSGAGRDGTRFCGQSMVVGPDGEVRGTVETETGVLFADVSATEVANTRRRLNVFRDRVQGLDNTPPFL